MVLKKIKNKLFFWILIKKYLQERSDKNVDVWSNVKLFVFNGKIWLLLLFNSGKPRIIERARNNWSQLYSCVWTVTN